MQKGLQRSTRHSRGVGQGRFWNWCAELHREGHSGAPGPQRHTTGSSNPVLPGELRPLEAAQPSSASGSRSPSGEQERKDRHSREQGSSVSSLEAFPPNQGQGSTLA